MINENILKGRWKEVKGAIQREWGKLTDDELDQAQGNLSELAGTIQKKYGTAQEAVREKLNAMIGKFGETKNETETPSRSDVRERGFEDDEETIDRVPRNEVPRN